MKQIITVLFLAIFAVGAQAQTAVATTSATSDTLTVRTPGTFGYSNVSLRGTTILDHDQYTLGIGAEFLKPLRSSGSNSTFFTTIINADFVLRDHSDHTSELSRLIASNSLGLGLSQMFHVSNSNLWLTVAPMVNWNFYDTRSQFSYLSLYGALNFAFSNNMFIGASYKHQPFVTNYEIDEFSQVGVHLGYSF